MSDTLGKITEGKDLIGKIRNFIAGFVGYVDRENRREADKILRETTAQRYEEVWSRISELQRQLISEGKLELVDDLELPKIGSFSFGMELSSAMLKDEPSAEELAKEEEAIRGRVEAGTATAADYARRAEILGELDRSEESKAARARARELYEAALEADADDVDALVGLGRLLVGDIEGERAEELLTRAIELEPENVDGRMILYSIMVAKGDLDQARAVLEETQAIAPGDVRILRQLAFVASESGESPRRASARSAAATSNRARASPSPPI